MPALHHVREAFPEVVSADGLLTSFNPTFDAGDGSDRGWLSPYTTGSTRDRWL